MVVPGEREKRVWTGSNVRRKSGRSAASERERGEGEGEGEGRSRTSMIVRWADSMF